MTGGLTLAENDSGGESLPSDLAERAAVEWPFEVQPLFSIDLMVDHSYQRPLEERWVNERRGPEFNRSLVGVLDVSLRANGERALLDGQQRWELLRLEGITTCWGAVYTGMSYEDEAGYFYRANKERKPMKGFYGFRARSLAGDLEAQAIWTAVRAADFDLGPVTDHKDVVGSVTALERAWRLPTEHRDEAMTPALETIRAAFYGRAKSLQSETIMGLAHFFRSYPDSELSTPVLLGALEKIGSPSGLVGLGRDRIARETSDWRLPQATAMALVEHYNADVVNPTERLDPQWLR